MANMKIITASTYGSLLDEIEKYPDWYLIGDITVNEAGTFRALIRTEIECDSDE